MSVTPQSIIDEPKPNKPTKTPSNEKRQKGSSPTPERVDDALQNSPHFITLQPHNEKRCMTSMALKSRLMPSLEFELSKLTKSTKSKTIKHAM